MIVSKETGRTKEKSGNGKIEKLTRIFKPGENNPFGIAARQMSRESGTFSFGKKMPKLSGPFC